MRIAIDVREACKAKRTGKGQWAFGLVEELLRREFPLLCFTNEPLPFGWEESGAVQSLIPFSGWKWHVRVASLLRDQNDIDLYVSPTSFLVPYLLGKKFPHVPVVHDLIAFQNDRHDAKAKWIEHLTLQRAMQTAKHVFTLSQATKQDLLSQYSFLDPANLTPVYAGPMQEQVPLSQPDGKTILCIATLNPRKNQLRLIQAYASLPEHVRSSTELVLAGARGWHDDEILELVKRTPGVIWKEYVSDEEYQSLMHTATVFALPSLYEGFGLQILDAMQRGIPVLTSDRGSLKEVADSTAYVVDPENVTAIAHGLESLLTDHGLREQLRIAGPNQARQFSWDRTGNIVLSVLERLRSE
jgi:alpha-1,3-rhamnosyl/mannosyltransferase